jgi:threonine dehydratase
MRLVYERMKLVIEPSAAVPLAVALYSLEFRDSLDEIATRRGKSSCAKLNVGIVFSGGNVDVTKLGELLCTVD